MRRLLKTLLLLSILAALAGTAVLVASGRDVVARGKDFVRDPIDTTRDLIDRADRPKRQLPMAKCPPGLERCAAVRGRVVYVEAVDPDGDGDLHVVIAGGSVTAPGLTAVDVRPDLRPQRDPRIGDLATAAGQVQPGSRRQSQIHAEEFRIRPLGG